VPDFLRRDCPNAGIHILLPELDALIADLRSARARVAALEGEVDSARAGAAREVNGIAEVCDRLRTEKAELRAARDALRAEVERLRGDRKKPGLPRCADCGIPAPEGAHVLIIVNGEDVAVPVAVGESLSHARERALQQTKNTGRPPEEWEIRSATGRLLDPWARLGPEHYRGRHVWIDGDGRLFLTLRIGFGG
jgi:hypothetical protein